MNGIAEFIGIFGLSATILSYQCKSRRGILLLQVVATSCWVIHFSLLGALAGAALNGIGMLRCLVFSFRGKRWADWIGWIPIFILLSAAAVVATWKGVWDLLPFFAMILTTFAVRATSAKMVRLLTLPNDPMWLIYNAYSGSISGVITEICIMTSIIVGYFRHDRKKKS